MTNKEVIRILERKTTIPGDGYTWEQINEAIELAIVALRAGGKDMNVPTMQAVQPLTLEQLRAELEQKSKLRKMARAIEGEIAKCTLWRQAGNRL